MRTPLAVALLLTLAGCLASPGPDEAADGGGDAAPEFAPVVPPVPDFDFGTVVQPDHGNHNDPALHTVGHGLELVGHAYVHDVLPSEVKGAISAIDLWDDWAVVAGMDGGLGFALLDLSDRTAPEAVSWFRSAANGFSARFSDDGNYVFYGCQMLGPTGNALSNVQGTCEDPDALHAPDPTNPLGEGGIVAVDVSDKSDPRFVDFLPGLGSHNLIVATIAGQDTIVTDAGEILVFDRAAGELRKLSEVPLRHDGTLARHPLTGDWLLAGGGGSTLNIYSLSDPAEPTALCEDCLTGFEGWHEQTFIPGLVDGRFLLALGGESVTGLGGEQLGEWMVLVDVTDPADPARLSQWQPPFAPLAPWVDYTFSIHEMAATPTGQLAIAWYHAGVWVVDVSTRERQADPAILAAYQPHESMPEVLEPGTYSGHAVPFVPTVWGAGWTRDGYLVVPDVHTGLYVLEPAWGLHPAIDSGQ